jgi:hypothetical protein
MSTIGNWRGSNIIKDGLVLYLDPGSPNSYYDKTSTTIKDISGSGRLGTLTNGAVYNSSNGGNIVFDGSDDLINLGVSNNLLSFGTNPFSINIWLYPTNIGSGGGYQPILTTYNNYNSGFSTYFLMAIFNDAGIYNGIGMLDASGDFLGGFSSGFALPLTNNTWVNICFTRSGDNFVGYINGVQSKTLTTSTNWSGVGRSIKIGSGVVGIGSYRGNLSNLMIYNKTLSSQEVLQNFNSTKSRFGL